MPTRCSYQGTAIMELSTSGDSQITCSLIDPLQPNHPVSHCLLIPDSDLVLIDILQCRQCLDTFDGLPKIVVVLLCADENRQTVLLTASLIVDGFRFEDLNRFTLSSTGPVQQCVLGDGPTVLITRRDVLDVFTRHDFASWSHGTCQLSCPLTALAISLDYIKGSFNIEASTNSLFISVQHRHTSGEELSLVPGPSVNCPASLAYSASCLAYCQKPDSFVIGCSDPPAMYLSRRAVILANKPLSHSPINVQPVADHVVVSFANWTSIDVISLSSFETVFTVHDIEWCLPLNDRQLWTSSQSLLNMNGKSVESSCHLASLSGYLLARIHKGCASLERDEGLVDYKRALLNHAKGILDGHDVRFPLELLGKSVPNIVSMFKPPVGATNMIIEEQVQSAAGISSQPIISAVRENYESDRFRIEVDVYNGSEIHSIFSVGLLLRSNNMMLSTSAPQCSSILPKTGTSIALFVQLSEFSQFVESVSSLLVLSWRTHPYQFSLSSTLQSSNAPHHMDVRPITIKRRFSKRDVDIEAPLCRPPDSYRQEHPYQTGLSLHSDKIDLRNLSNVFQNMDGFYNVSQTFAAQHSRTTLFGSKYRKFRSRNAEVELGSLNANDAQLAIGSVSCSRVSEIVDCIYRQLGDISLSIDWSSPCFYRIAARVAEALQQEMEHVWGLIDGELSVLMQEGGSEANDSAFLDSWNRYRQALPDVAEYQKRTDLAAAKLMAFTAEIIN